MQGWRRNMEDAHTILLSLSETNPQHRFFGMPQSKYTTPHHTTPHHTTPHHTTPHHTTPHHTTPHHTTPHHTTPHHTTPHHTTPHHTTPHHTTPHHTTPHHTTPHHTTGVFDGHCGPSVAQWSSKHLTKHVESSARFDHGDYEVALVEGFVSLDRELRRNGVPGGSTGVTLLTTPDGELYCANVGDSRCVISEGGQAVALSVDHKPTLPAEQARIVRAGGYVAGGRVLGSLAMSRALGDFNFKPGASVSGSDPAEEMVTVVPEVMRRRVTEHTEFIVVACDGIWDCVTSQQCIDFVGKKMRESPEASLSSICSALFDVILASRPFGLGCDNMSMLIIKLKTPPCIGPPPTPHSDTPANHIDEDDPDLVIVKNPKGSGSAGKTAAAAAAAAAAASAAGTSSEQPAKLTPPCLDTDGSNSTPAVAAAEAEEGATSSAADSAAAGSAGGAAAESGGSGSAAVEDCGGEQEGALDAKASAEE